MFCVKESIITQPKREFAYLWGGKTCGFAWRPRSGKVNSTTQRSNKQTVVTCHYRYPSPNRSVFAQDRPVSLFRRSIAKCVFDIGYQVGFNIECRIRSAVFGAFSHNLIGKIKCKRNQSSSPQSPSLAWPAVWIPTLNVASLAQVPAWLPQTLWALIQRVQPLPVPLSPSCATTQAFAARHAKSSAHIGRQNQKNRRRGVPPAAVFCLGDG